VMFLLLRSSLLKSIWMQVGSFASPSRTLPPELLIVIFNHVLDKMRSGLSVLGARVLRQEEMTSLLAERICLLQVALVCRTWYLLAREILYSYPILLPDVWSLLQFRRTLDLQPSLGAKITEIGFLHWWKTSPDTCIQTRSRFSRRHLEISKEEVRSQLDSIFSTCPNVDTLTIIVNLGSSPFFFNTCTSMEQILNTTSIAKNIRKLTLCDYRGYLSAVAEHLELLPNLEILCVQGYIVNIGKLPPMKKLHTIQLCSPRSLILSSPTIRAVEWYPDHPRCRLFSPIFQQSISKMLALESFTFIDKMEFVIFNGQINFGMLPHLRHLLLGVVSQWSFHGDTFRSLEFPKTLETLGFALSLRDLENDNQCDESSPVIEPILHCLQHNNSLQNLPLLRQLTIFTRSEELKIGPSRRGEHWVSRMTALEGYCFKNEIELVLDGQDLEHWITQRLTSIPTSSVTSGLSAI